LNKIYLSLSLLFISGEKTMLKILILLIIISTFVSCTCNCHKKPGQNEGISTLGMSENNLSPMTKKFISDLKNELKNRQTDKDYIPSDDFKKKYNLLKIDNEEYVGALIQVSNDFKKEKLKEIGVKIGTEAGEVWTLKVPILKFESILNVPGITYMQIDEPIHIK
jgi:hypothetical protein